MTDTVILDIKRACGDGFLYLATPYTHYHRGVYTAFEDAARAAAWFIERKISVFCPIAHTHPIAIHGDIDPKDHTIWMPVDKPLMESAKGLLVIKMPGWDSSKGVKIEIEEFEKARKPIFYVEWPLPEF